MIISPLLFFPVANPMVLFPDSAEIMNVRLNLSLKFHHTLVWESESYFSSIQHFQCLQTKFLESCAIEYLQADLGFLNNLHLFCSANTSPGYFHFKLLEYKGDASQIQQFSIAQKSPALCFMACIYISLLRWRIVQINARALQIMWRVVLSVRIKNGN